MRPLALLCVLLAAASLVGARFLSGEGFFLSLYGLPLFAGLSAVALMGAALEALGGARARAAWSAAGAALSAASIGYALFVRAPGALPEGRRLESLLEKAFSIGMLSAALGGGALCAAGLRAEPRWAQAAAALGLAAACAALAMSARAFGFPMIRPGLLAAVLGGGLLYLIWTSPSRGERH
jgi:hypothetical protein